MINEGYHTGQVCLSGHIITVSITQNPGPVSTYCSKCGEPTITKCPNCQANIRGKLDNMFFGFPGMILPYYCHNCGRPYPWTGRRIAAARELFNEIDNLNSKDKDILSQSLDDLIKDSPRTELAATRFKKIMATAGGEAISAARQILIDIISETAKKTIWP